MLTSSYIFSGLISSTSVSDLYGLIGRILCLIYVGPYCIFIRPLENNALYQMVPNMAFNIFM